MRIQMAGTTNIGRVRKSNQDALYFDGSQGLAIVADGIGGRKGGELASQMAVEGLRKAFLECDRLRHEEITPFLTTAIDRVNQDIIKRGESEGDKAGMGTTVNCLMFVGDRLHIAHVGDSRTYLYWKGHLWQLTLDHNIQMFIDRGWMARSELMPGMRQDAIVRSLGLSGRCEVDIYDIEVKSEEIFITCSDGLSGMVDDRKIATIIRQHESNIDALPDALVKEALKNGGKDNVTVVASKVRFE